MYYERELYGLFNVSLWLLTFVCFIPMMSDAFATTPQEVKLHVAIMRFLNLNIVFRAKKVHLDGVKTFTYNALIRKFLFLHK
jgi:hypothetical protein